MSSNKVKVLIYGLELLEGNYWASRNNKKYEVIGFIDDDRKLSRQVLLGKTIFHSSLENLIDSRI